MQESKRLVCSSSIVFCFLICSIPLAYFAFFQIDQWNANFASLEDVGKQEESLELLLRRLVRGEQRKQLEKTGFAYTSDLHSDMYLSSRELRFDTNSSRIYIDYDSNQEQKIYQVQPYPLLNFYGNGVKQLVSPVEVQHGRLNALKVQPCTHVHDVPTVIFSSGGLVGNIYHEISDVLIPLFITSRHFQSKVKFMVTDFHQWFVWKHENIFKKLSDYEVIDGNKAENGSVHCFPGGIVGLKCHGCLSLNRSEIPGGHSMPEFRQFIRMAYNVRIKDVSEVSGPDKKMNLLLLSRTETRTILNQDEVVSMMEELGFRVVISTPEMMSDSDSFVQIVSSCSVMVGVHGAGLTNELFLPAGAVAIQVALIGLKWAGIEFYGAPAKDMDLQYLEYEIEPEESSLFEIYGPDNPVMTGPESIEKESYADFRAIYLDKQNVKINVQRFRNTLVEAMRIVGRSN